MKTALYFILLIAEGFFGLISLLLLASWELWGILALTAAVFVFFMVFFILRHKRHTKLRNEKKLKSNRIFIALTMAIPSIPLAVTLIAVLHALATYG